MPRIRFLKDCGGRHKGDEEDFPDQSVIDVWLAKEVIEVIGRPDPPAVEDRKMPATPRATRSKPKRTRGK